MRRFVRVILSLAAVSLLGIVALAIVFYYKGPDMLRGQIENRLLLDHRVRTRIESLVVHLLPFPHLSARGVNLEHEAVVIKIPSLKIYPDFSRLLQGRISLSSLTLAQPQIRITSLEIVQNLLKQRKRREGSLCESFVFPDFSIQVDKGLLVSPLDGPLAALNGRIPAARFSDMDFKLTSDQGDIRLKGEFRSPYTGASQWDIGLETQGNETCSWAVDLGAETLDLGVARQVLPVLFPENSTVKFVFDDLIRSGHLRSATYSYKGGGDQWTDLNRMTAMAKADNIAIRIPGASRNIQAISGPIRLAGSVLGGESLSAAMLGSTTSDCRFSMGLGKSRRPFNLSADIKADLSGLPLILNDFITSRNIRKEIAMTGNFQGKADVQLTVKNNSGHFNTYVYARNIAAGFHSRRLDRKVTVDGGKLSITPERAAWSRISGRVGPQKIRESSGNLMFNKTMDVDILSLSGRVDSADAYSYLRSFRQIRTMMKSKLKSVSGIVDIETLSLNGPLTRPSELEFVVDASSEKLSVVSPELPSPAKLKFKNLHAGRHDLKTENLSVDLNGQVFKVNSDLEKSKNGNLTGRMVVRGRVDESLKSFILKKNWIPATFFPHLPLTLAPLDISWTDTKISLDATVIKKDSNGATIRCQTGIDIMKNQHNLRQMIIQAGPDTAELNAVIPRTPAAGTLSGHFKGKIQGATLAVLFENGKTMRGDMEGDAVFEYPLSGSPGFRLKGPLSVSDLVYFGSKGDALTLGKASIRGRGQDGDILLEDMIRTSPPGGSQTITIPQLTGNVFFLPENKARLDVRSGNICGVSFSGGVTLPAMNLDLSFSTDKSKPVNCQDLVDCLGLKTAAVTGTMDVEGSITGTPGMIEKGVFRVRAKDGVVRKSALLPKILSLLDVTELFSRNPIRGILTDGYRYDSMEIDGTITGDNIHISRAAIAGTGINFYATGYIDLESQTLDLVVLASPFKNVDSIVHHIPILGPFLGGKNKSVLSVPLVVEGDLKNPRTRFLPKTLSTVSSGIISIFVNTFKLPFVLTDALINPDKK